MKLVGARFRLDRDEARDRLTKLCIEVLKRNFGFLNGVEVRIDHDNAENWVLVVGTVELKCGTAEVLAIHENLLTALRVLRSCVTPAYELLCAGGKQFKVGEIAVENR